MKIGLLRTENIVCVHVFDKWWGQFLTIFPLHTAWQGPIVGSNPHSPLGEILVGQGFGLRLTCELIRLGFWSGKSGLGYRNAQ